MNQAQLKSIMVGIILAVVGLGIFLAYWERPPSGLRHSDSPPETPQSGAAPKALIAFDGPATELYGEYQKSERAANRRYQGKGALITGTVHTIEQDVFGDPYLVLEAGRVVEGVQCSFPKSRIADVAKIRVGQNVKVQGTVSGLLFRVQVTHCVVR